MISAGVRAPKVLWFSRAAAEPLGRGSLLAAYVRKEGDCWSSAGSCAGTVGKASVSNLCDKSYSSIGVLIP